jgi:hypothetical protein
MNICCCQWPWHFNWHFGVYQWHIYMAPMTSCSLQIFVTLQLICAFYLQNLQNKSFVFTASFKTHTLLWLLSCKLQGRVKQYGLSNNSNNWTAASGHYRSCHISAVAKTYKNAQCGKMLFLLYKIGCPFNGTALSCSSLKGQSQHRQYFLSVLVTHICQHSSETCKSGWLSRI